MSDTIILHMSDLHFSSNEEKKREKDVIMNFLVDALKDLEEEWRPNVICVSGDIVDRYDVAAYSIAGEWFRKLAEILNIPMDNFILTPGNHDCSRDIKKYPRLDSNDDGLVDEVLNCDIPAYLSGRFEAYEKFCEDLKITPYTWQNGDNYLVGYRVINDVIYLGCNTEWFAYSDETKLRLGKKIVEELQQASDALGDFKKVAIMHHGGEVGFHENEVQYHNDICPALHYLWRICDMTLYGHSHEQVGGEPNKMENHCFTIRAGATSINREYPNNINIIKIVENAIELKHISYDQQRVEQLWKVSDDFLTYTWETVKDDKDISGTVSCDMDLLRQKERLYAREILNGKLRQVKTGAKLPETILRDVVIDSDQKRHEQERGKENSEKNREVRLLDVVLAERRVVICGELGAGKSTILSQAVLEMLDNNTTSLPILISAKELAEENDGKTGSVLQQICNFMQQQLLVTVSSVGEMLDCVDQCYLFVDGLDEVDKRQQEPLMRVLEQISLMENRISIILSTRSTETIEYHRDNWTQCSLGRLHQQEILRILENEAKTEEDGEGATTRAKQYFKKINNNPMVQLVATTPLAVRLLYYIMRKNIEIDEYTIGDLLNTLLEERISYWDAKNTSEVTGEEFERNFPTVDAKKNYIGYLAYCAEKEKITRKKLELMLEQGMQIQNDLGLVAGQTISKLQRNGMTTEVDGGIVFTYRPLAQIAMGIYMADKIIKGELQANNCSPELWREISFAAGELRRADLVGKYRGWLETYIDNLKKEAAGLIKACYICYEAKDTVLARKMIENFKEKDIRPLWYYEPEKNVSVSIVAQVIALAGEYGVDWFIDSYLTLTYPVINAGSAFFRALLVVLPPLIKDALTSTQKDKLKKCIEPLEYICPIAYSSLPEILCFLMPDRYPIERRLQLIARISFYDEYQEWAQKEYEALSKEHKELCQKVLKNEKTFGAAVLWMKVFDDAPDINLTARIIEHGDEELIEMCRHRLGEETYIRYLRWLVAESSYSIAAASALQLCNYGQDKLPEVRVALVGGMTNAGKNNRYEKKIMELIAADGGLNKQWIRILFAGEHHVYGASEGSWRIFLRFLLKAKEDFTQDFIGNLKYMGPFLLARCEETRLLLQRLLIMQEYKNALIAAMNSLDPEIRCAASKIGLIACQDLEGECLLAVVSECAGEKTDNFEWQDYVAEKKYREESIKKLSEKMPVMFPRMKVLADRIIKNNMVQEIEEPVQMTKKEQIDKEIEGVAEYGVQYLRRYLNILNHEVDYRDYLQMREKYKNKPNAEVLYCFHYENQHYVVDWYEFLWYLFIGRNTLFHEADVIMLEVIAYGKSNADAAKAIVDAVKRICEDERLEKERWISNYHWLLLLRYTFEGIEDATIKEAFIRKEEYMGEAGLALLAIYSGDLQELNIKKKKGKTLGAVTQNDCQNQLLELAKESERISKQLDEAMQTFVQENGNINKEYIDQLIELGENGALIAGALCFCYGEPVRAESGIVAHQTYFFRSKIDSEIFRKLLRLTRTVFESQLDEKSKLEEYKRYLEESEAHLEEVRLDKCFYISEYLYYMKDKITDDKIFKYLDIVMKEMHYSKYDISIWDMLVEYMNSNEGIEQAEIAEVLEMGIHRIIGACEEDRSFWYNEAYGQIAISCMYWKAKKEYSNLAQPIFERGIVQLIRAKYDKNLWDEENEPVKFQKIKKYLNMVPKPIMCQAIEGMKNSWLEEAIILGGLIGILNKSNI